MSFDYSTLLMPVRRLINDVAVNEVEINEQTENTSRYIKLAADGYIVPVSSGVIINGIVIDESGYTVNKNVLRMVDIVPAGSDVFVQYDVVNYTDQFILDTIDDTIHYTIEPIFRTDFGFGDTYPAPSGVVDYNTYTADDVDDDLAALFVHGSALQVLGIKLTEAGDDAIYIKDGDTIINTAASAQEKARGYEPIYRRFMELLEIVRINRFEGVTMF